MRQDVPDAEFDLVLCRNAVLTYMVPPLQRKVVERVISRVRPGGALVIGTDESLPDDLSEITPWPGAHLTRRTPTLATRFCAQWGSIDFGQQAPLRRLLT